MAATAATAVTEEVSKAVVAAAMAVKEETVEKAAVVAVDMVPLLTEREAVVMVLITTVMAAIAIKEELPVFALSPTPSKNPKNNPNKRR